MSFMLPWVPWGWHTHQAIGGSLGACSECSGFALHRKNLRLQKLQSFGLGCLPTCLTVAMEGTLSNKDAAQQTHVPSALEEDSLSSNAGYCTNILKKLVQTTQLNIHLSEMKDTHGELSPNNTWTSFLYQFTTGEFSHMGTYHLSAILIMIWLTGWNQIGLKSYAAFN